MDTDYSNMICAAKQNLSAGRVVLAAVGVNI